MREGLDGGCKSPLQAVKSCRTAVSLSPPRGSPSLGWEDGGGVALDTPEGQRGFVRVGPAEEGRQVWSPCQAPHAPAGPPCVVPSPV